MKRLIPPQLLLGALFGLLCVGCSGGKKVESYPDSFVGVGLELRIEEDYPVVVRALPGGSADSMGLEPGDVVEEIDGVSTEAVSLGNIVMKIRGEPGTQVTLAVQRETQRMIFVIPRRKMIKKDESGSMYRAQRE